MEKAAKEEQSSSAAATTEPPPQWSGYQPQKLQKQYYDQGAAHGRDYQWKHKKKPRKPAEEDWGGDADEIGYGMDSPHHPLNQPLDEYTYTATTTRQATARLGSDTSEGGNTSQVTRAPTRNGPGRTGVVQHH
eukprot:3005891-Amphidinium_carterae.1